jgi:TonB family protein
MKSAILSGFLALFYTILSAQTTTTPTDTTIYEFADKTPYPLLKRCQIELHQGWTEDSVRRCAERNLLSLIAQNIQYPVEARQKNIQGVVVVSLVIEPDGRASNLKVMRDIGSGCGDEAIRVVKGLSEVGLRWQPAVLKGKNVRMRTVLPLRFRLEEAKPYNISAEGDTIYAEVDSMPQFKGGMDALMRFVINRLNYPAAYKDSCKTGIVEMALLIFPNNTVKIDNQLDFNNLGVDFQFEALRMANRTAGEWMPATYNGTPVCTSLPLRALFKSDKPGCKTANDRFDQAMRIADEAAALTAENKGEEALKKWGEAIALQPNNTELLYYRGTALLNMQRRDESCADYNRIKAILGTTWFEGIRKLMCAK